MSWSIAFQVVDGVLDPESIQASSGGTAPPNGNYTVNGHVHHEHPSGEADAQPMLGVSTPMGTVNSYLAPGAYVLESTEECAGHDD